MFVECFSKFLKHIASLHLHKIPMGKQNRCYHKSKVPRGKLSCLKIHKKLFIGKTIIRIYIFFFPEYLTLFFHDFSYFITLNHFFYSK